MMYDKNFLRALDLAQIKEKYVRITALNYTDRPIESIEGICTGGSINIDGKSAVRRSCSLSFVAAERKSPINDVYWAFDNLFRLEIGLKNEIDPSQPDIIWFKQGVYVINSYSRSESPTGITINISGQDKMCRLNGSINGALPHEVAFGVIDEIDAMGSIETTYLTIPQIIRSAVKEYGQERDENILINDLDTYGYELWAYKGDKPIYLFLDVNDKKPLNLTTQDNFLALNSGFEYYYSLNTLNPEYNNIASRINFNSKRNAFVIKIENREAAGYHQIPLYPASELILGTGETVTSLLDKIKNQLGEYEYFYDLDGHFVFQKKPNYIQELFSPIDGRIITPTMIASPYSYTFDNDQLLTQYSLAPKIDNIKNDFIVWGLKKNPNGLNIKIHSRYAIDKKPTTSYKNQPYQEKCAPLFLSVKEQQYNKTDESNYSYYRLSANGSYYLVTDLVDGKYYYIIEALTKRDANTNKTLYQKKGNDYIQLPDDDNYSIPLEQIIDVTTIDLYRIHKQQEYDSTSFDWREIIYQMALDYYRHNEEPDFLAKLESSNPLCIGGKTGYEPYYSDLQAFWRLLYDPEGNPEEYYTDPDLPQELQAYKYWNKKINLDATQLIFWFDFLDLGDSDQGLGKYSVQKIGRRSKVVNDNQVSAIFQNKAPEVLYEVIGKEKIQEDNMAFQPMRIPQELAGLFGRSTQGISAIERINELLFQHSYTADGLNITAIPIYYLEPNTRVNIHGEDYTLDRISYQLNYNGTMTLTCTKIAEQLF